MKKTLFAVSLSFLVLVSQTGCGSGGGSTPSAGSSVVTGGAGASGSGTAATGGTAATDGTASTAGSGSAGATAPAGVAKLSWTPTVGVAGFKVYYGTSPRSYANSIDVGMVSSYSVNGLAPGTYYFAVTAYDSAGNESVFSSEVSKTIS